MLVNVNLYLFMNPSVKGIYVIMKNFKCIAMKRKKNV